MYTFNSRVRYSEVDRSGQLSLLSIVNYLQDCSTFQSEDLGFGVSKLLETRQVWLLSAWQIVIDRYPKLYEPITIGTAPYEFRSVAGFRNFWIADEQSEKLAWANSVWTLFDLVKGYPTKPSPEMMEAFVLSEKLAMDYADRRIKLPADGGQTLASIEIKEHFLDSNNHVNNAQYVGIALELLGGRCQAIKQLRAEYRKPALLGDTLYPLLYSDSAKEIVSLADSEGKPYCIVEFQS
jgi:acyl-ACP thioesterase